MNSMILLVAIALLGLFWFDSARAREITIELARTLCQRRGLQLLDDTVTLRRMGLRWGSQGIRIRRMFSFDFSVEGMGRRNGYIILIGSQVELTELGLEPQAEEEADSPAEEQAETKPAETKPENKVLPFRRPNKDD